MGLLSLVVPFYNNVESIDSALCSLRRALSFISDNNGIEIIFVDNNSTDGTKDKVQAFLLSDARSFLVHETQQGVSHARNRGLDAANGKYVGFLDADDEINQDYFLLILEAISSDPDVIFLSPFADKANLSNCNRKDFVKCHLRGWWTWQFVFRKGLASGVRFYGRCFEDFGFFPKVISRADTFCSIGGGIYVYKNNAKSLTKSNIEFLNHELSSQFAELWKSRNSLDRAVQVRAEADYLDHISLLRAIDMRAPLSAEEVLRYLALMPYADNRLRRLLGLSYRSLSVMYRRAKRLVMR